MSEEIKTKEELKQVMEEKEQEELRRILNPNFESQIVYVRSITPSGIIKDDVELMNINFDRITLTKEIKNEIWIAIGYALNAGKKDPFTILLPRKMVTRKRVPVGEVPIPFGNSTIHIIPHIKKILVLENYE